MQERAIIKCSKTGCGANTIRDDDLCFSHSQKPEIVEKRKAARSKGGSRGKLRVVDSPSVKMDLTPAKE